MQTFLNNWFLSLKQENFAYRDLLGQDQWIEWTPTRTSWTDVGVPTVTARYHVIGRQCFFQIKVVPSTTVATTAGTSYVNLPITALGLSGEGSMQNATTLVAIGSCVIDTTNSRVYVPSQVATGNTILISGWFEI